MAESFARFGLVIGNPIGHSLSPLLHNSAYSILGLASKYILSAAQVLPSQLGDAVAGMRAFDLFGMSVTLPHKQGVLPLLDELDKSAAEIGAVNTIVPQNNKLVGYNTDHLGILGPLKALRSLKAAKVALLGAGGAARAALYALKSVQAQVCIFNRTPAKALALSQEFQVRSAELKPSLALDDYDIVINATSVGLNPSETPLEAKSLHKGQIVFDLIYNPADTKLLQHARQAGCICIPGIEMFLAQGIEQVRLFTGHAAPIEPLRTILLKYLSQAA